MAALSKFYDFDNKLNTILYYTKIVLIQKLITDLTFCIYNISKSFYKSKIKNNNLFSSVFENPFLHVNKESIQIFYYLYYFVIEEFYYIWTHEKRDEMANKILQQLQIIEEFTHIHFNLSFLNTQMISSIPLMIMSKTKDQILFQFTYFIHMFFITYVKYKQQDIIQSNLNKCVLNHSTYKNNMLLNDVITILTSLVSLTNFKIYRKTFDIYDLIDFMYIILIDCNQFYNKQNQIIDMKFLLSPFYNFKNLLNYS
jgi:hypothetical protein